MDQGKGVLVHLAQLLGETCQTSNLRSVQGMAHAWQRLAGRVWDDIVGISCKLGGKRRLVYILGKFCLNLKNHIIQTTILLFQRSNLYHSGHF